MKKNSIGIIVFVIIIIVIIGFFGCKKKDDVNVLTDEEVVHSGQVKTDVAGIAQQVFSETNIAYVTSIEGKDFEGENKKWLVVVLQGDDGWRSLDDAKKEGIMRGLINTSRLQLDRNFGGVQILFDSAILMEGRWSVTGGYVMI